MKKCAIIMPYFGHFNNYFELFLKFCGYNEKFDWMIFTDDTKRYAYPSNVHVYPFTLEKVKKLAEEKIDKNIRLEVPYKLCDYKPTYGLLFEDYLHGYDYWGHCDCDLIFGNLEGMLEEILEADYDKIFAAGHLTLYKNNKENNIRFMKKYNEEYLYKSAFSKDDIYVFDEDMGDKNIHSIFLSDCAKVYSKDLSMNTAINSARIIRDKYVPEERKFVKQPYQAARYFWYKGKILSVREENNAVIYDEYLYMHLQMRNMRMKADVLKADCVQILPDRFVVQADLPQNVRDLKKFMIGFPYLYWMDEYKKKVYRKLKKVKNKLRR